MTAEQERLVGNAQTIRVLAVNSGSSSLKFAVYDMGSTEALVLSGAITGIGLGEGAFRVRAGDGSVLADQPMALTDQRDAVRTVLGWLEANDQPEKIDAVGYRVVHGGPQYTQPHLVTPELMKALDALSPVDPDHLPQAIAVIGALRESYPDVKHVACFDTAFHRTMPKVAQMYALPRFVHDEGGLRYGFHGLSYEYIVEQLERDAGPEAAKRRLIIAHLGNGASIVAVKDGRSLETTMGFSPAGGLVMSTRSGDLDPGIILYLLRQKHISLSQLDEMVNKQAGLLGVSGFSADMKELLSSEEHDPKAALAVELFCYQARKFIGALAAVLNGLDSLIFTGGIGENAPAIRERICAGLDFLGLRLDSTRNRTGAPIISCGDGPVPIWVMKTNEELMIARHTRRFIG
jgi:acetate kinase